MTSPSLFEKLGADILARMFEVAAHGLLLLDQDRRLMHINAAGCHILGRSYEALLGRDLLLSVTETQRPEAEAWLSQSFQGEPHKQDLTVERPNTQLREVSFFCVPVLLEDEWVGLTALHDVTEVRRAESEARQLAALTSKLGLTRSLQDICQVVAESVVEMTEGDASAVILINEGTPYGHVAGSYGLPEAFVAAKEAALLAGATSLAQDALEQGRPLVVRNVAQHYLDQPGYAPLHPYTRALPWATLVSVALRYRGRGLGAILSYYLPGVGPTQAELDFLQTVADQSVFALENARLFSEVQDKAVLEERQRMARELHDSVSQALYGIALGTRSARSQLLNNPERVAERLDYVLNLAEASLAEMRVLIFELRPETLASEGLVAALRKQATAAQARHHVAVTPELAEEPELPLVAKEAFYRIAQEALYNIVKHARAENVRLSLESQVHKVVLEVADDGVGFDPQGSFPGHLGLSSMRERAASLGGYLHIDSAPGRGTRVRVELPLQAAQRSL